MDAQTPTTQPVNQPNSGASSKKTSNFFSLFGKIMLGLLIVGLVLFGGYYLGANKAKPASVSPTPSLSSAKPTTITPIGTTSTPTDSGIPIKANTVSFTRVNGEVFMRYKGKVYNEEAASKNDSSLTKLADPDSHTWYGLVDAPAIGEPAGFDELFDFKVFPNKQNFVFVMRWPTTGNVIDYKVFYYDVYATETKVSNMLSLQDGVDGSDQNVPRVKQINPEGKYVAFNMFSCWNCGGHAPDTLLLKIDTKATKRIGKVSYFNWKENGNYEYKAYKVIPCEVDGPGECSEDPKTCQC